MLRTMPENAMTRWLVGTVDTAGEPFLSYESTDVSSMLSLVNAATYFSAPFPVFLADTAGSIAACNVAAGWLAGVAEADALVEQNFFGILARLVDNRRVWYGCNQVILTKKDKLADKLIAGGSGVDAHVEFRDTLKRIKRQPGAKSCPINLNERPRHAHERETGSGKSIWRCPLFVSAAPGDAPEDALEFLVTDSEIIGHEGWFLITCVPHSPDAQGAMAAFAGQRPTGGAARGTVTAATLEKAMATHQLGDFGTALRGLRERRGLEAKELAALINVTPGAVGHWELGRRQLTSPERLVRILDVLGASRDERRQLAALAGFDVETEFGGFTRSRDDVLSWISERLGYAAELESSIADLQKRVVAMQAKLSTTLVEVRVTAGQWSLTAPAGSAGAAAGTHAGVDADAYADAQADAPADAQDDAYIDAYTGVPSEAFADAYGDAYGDVYGEAFAGAESESAGPATTGDAFARRG
jgi:transcriptional regulator with XRE-family HTH domain